MSDRPDPFAPRDRPDPFLPRERYDPFAPQQPAPEPAPKPEAPAEPAPPTLRKSEPLWSGKDVDYEQPIPPPQIPGAEEQAKQKAKRFGGPVGVFLLAFWKIGRIALVALGKVAILFKIPILGSVLSGAISIGAYALFYGWTFAIGLVGSLLVHELGHVVALRREGMPIKALNFVPFFGAYVMSDRARSLDQQARISIAGPIAGMLCALAIYAAVPNDPAWRAVAYTGFFLNMINLFPIPMLDGGGVGTLFSPPWWIGIAAALGVVWAASGVEFAAIGVFSSLLMAYFRRSEGWTVEPADGVPLSQRVQAAVLYVGVMAVCAFGMSASFHDRTNDLVNRYGSSGATFAQVR